MPDHHLTPEQQDAVHRRAYSLYLQRGANHGRALDDWVLAEQEVLGPVRPQPSVLLSPPPSRRRPWLAMMLVALAAGLALFEYARYLETRQQLEHTWRAVELLVGSHREQPDPVADLALLAQRLTDLEAEHRGALAEVVQLRQQLHQQHNQQLASTASQQAERIQLQQHIDELTKELVTLQQNLAIPLINPALSPSPPSSSQSWLAGLMASTTAQAELPHSLPPPPPENPVSEKPLPVDERYALLQLEGALLFDPGTARLTKTGEQQLASMAWASQQHPDRLVVVEGHADNRPLGPAARYPSNWELSAARAGAAVRYLEQLGLDPNHLVAVGLGEYHPARPEQPSHPDNRRVEVVLAPTIEQLPQRSLSVVSPPIPPRPPSGGRYALQLLGSYDSGDLERYASRYRLGDETRIVHTVWEGRDWYVLLYGRYQTLTSARQALLGLPDPLRSRQPWIRDQRGLDACTDCRSLATASVVGPED